MMVSGFGVGDVCANEQNGASSSLDRPRKGIATILISFSLSSPKTAAPNSTLQNHHRELFLLLAATRPLLRPLEGCKTCKDVWLSASRSRGVFALIIFRFQGPT